MKPVFHQSYMTDKRGPGQVVAMVAWVGGFLVSFLSEELVIGSGGNEEGRRGGGGRTSAATTASKPLTVSNAFIRQSPKISTDIIDDVHGGVVGC